MEAEEIHFQKHSVSHRLSFCNGQIAHHFASNSLYSLCFFSTEPIKFNGNDLFEWQVDTVCSEINFILLLHV